MTSHLRTLLLLSTAFTLISCDDGDNAEQSNMQTRDSAKSLASFYSPLTDAYPEKTLSGSYLAGQFAQNRADWNNAANYFDSVHDMDPNAPMVENRIMALAIGSGDYTRALVLAKRLVNATDSSSDRSMAVLLLGLEAMKNSDFTKALTITDKTAAEGLGVAVVPLFRAWASAGLGKTDITELLNKQSFIYQAVLIAGYTGDKKTLDNLANQYDFVRTSTPVKNLEDVAAVFARNGNTEEARAIFTALKNALPERSEFFTTQLKNLDSGNVSAFANPVVSPQKSLAEALIGVAQLLSGSYQDSARIFAHMAAYLEPADGTVYELLAQIAADAGQYDDAINYLSHIDTKNDEKSQIQVQRQVALLLQQSGKQDEAIRILSDLVKDQKSVEAQIQIGDIYRATEQYPKSLEAYDNAVKLLDNKVTQKYWDLLFARGMVNERLKNWDQAEKDLQSALSYEPDQPYVLNYLGYSWADQGKNLDKAAEMIEKAVRLKPDDGAIVDSLGWIYYRTGKFNKAVTTLEQAIELQPNEAEINDHLGDAYWRVGRKNEARFQWKRAISFTTEQELIDKINQKLENGLPAMAESSSVTPPEKLVENR